MESKTLLLLCWAALLPSFAGSAANNQILGWNNLGMHCMDSDYSVFRAHLQRPWLLRVEPHRTGRGANGP